MTNRTETIIFFSLHYPFHFTDSYLDEEINLLAKKFNRVIVISSNTFSIERRATPPNVIVYRFTPVVNSIQKIDSLSLLFRPLFYKNFLRILFDSKIDVKSSAIKELFAFYSRALATKKYLEKIISKQKIDKNKLLIYTYWMIESSMAAILLKKQNKNIKVISRAHSQDVYFERSPVNYHPYRKYIFNRLNHLFFISENAEQYFIQKYSLTQKEQQKISVSRIGVEGSDRSYLPKKPDDVLRIISVGYIQKIKRIDLIVDALALINDVKIEWYHAGHSNQSKGDFETLKQYAEEKISLLENISFSFLGKTKKKDLFKLYEEKCFDVFLNVSETEGIPVSMMEAMSYSVPVIGTNVGGVSEIVMDGINGFLINPYPDAEELMKAIQYFYELSTEKKSELRLGAFNTWNTKYNGEKNNFQFAEWVESVVNEEQFQ